MIALEFQHVSLEATAMVAARSLSKQAPEAACLSIAPSPLTY